MKVLRYSAVAAVAIFAAACGDKVTVAGPTAVTLTSTTTTTTTTTPVAPGKINSIAVAPAAVTLTIGQAVTLVAAVNADPGIATTVTWSSSDATKASVVAGLVTAVAATPGVAICATSTVNVGVKGCASVVVTATTAVTPATATIAGIYQGNLTTPVVPSNVTGSVFVQVNVDPGTQVVNKVLLLMGTTVVDSQVFTSAQSASLRYAAETAGATTAEATQAEVSSLITLTVNTAAFDATTGAVTHTNAGARSISVQLFAANATTATSTAAYSNSLTLNNPDSVYATYAYPTTKVVATDASGYTWTGFGGGNATLNIVPVLYSGKVVSNATLKYATANFGSTWGSYCDAAGANSTGCLILPTTADTLLTKTVTGTGAFGITMGLTHRACTAAACAVASPATPTISLVYTDGSSMADAAFHSSSLAGLRIRIDNKGPARPTITAATANASLTVLRPAASFTIRPTVLATTAADSNKLIVPTGSTSDEGVSAGTLTQTEQFGITFNTYKNVGGVSATTSDTLLTTMGTAPLGTTALTGFSEVGKWCFRMTATDRLGNVSANYNDGAVTSNVVVNGGCEQAPASGQLFAIVDGTAPVVTWQTTNYMQGDTAVNASSILAGNDVKYTVTETNTISGGTQILSCVYTTSGSTVAKALHNSLGSSSGSTTATTCDTYATQAANGGVSNMISTAAVKWADAAITTNGVYVIYVKATDGAGYVSSVLTKYVIVDGTNPTVTTPTTTAGTLGTASTVVGYSSDNVDVYGYALQTQRVASYGSSATITTVNLVVNSAAARVAATLEGDPTVVNSTFAVPTAGRFFNVALSSTSALQYIMPLQIATGDTANFFAFSSVAAPNEVRLNYDTYRTQHAFTAYDRVGNSATSSYVASTTVDTTLTPVVVGGTSRFTMVGNGLINAVDATTPDAGAVGVTSVIKMAMTSALASANAGYATTQALSLTVKMFRYQDMMGAILRTAAHKIENGYCAGNAASSTTQIWNTSNAESQYAIGSQIASTAKPSANAAPVVHVYAPLVGAASWGYVGALTTSNEVGAANSAGYCDDTDTRTYTGTWTISSRAPATQWSNGQLIYVMSGVGGHGTIVRGPYVDLVK